MRDLSHVVIWGSLEPTGLARHTAPNRHFPLGALRESILATRMLDSGCNSEYTEAQ